MGKPRYLVARCPLPYIPMHAALQFATCCPTPRCPSPFTPLLCRTTPCSPLLTALHPADMQTATCCNLALCPSPRCQSQGSLLDCTPRPCTPLLPHNPLCVDCSPLLAALPCTLHGLLVADWKATLTRDDPENGEPKRNKAERLSRVKI